MSGSPHLSKSEREGRAKNGRTLEEIPALHDWFSPDGTPRSSDEAAMDAQANAHEPNLPCPRVPNHRIETGAPGTGPPRSIGAQPRQEGGACGRARRTTGT